MGHEDAFPRPRLSGGCGLGYETFAGRRGNEKDAPITVIPATIRTQIDRRLRARAGNP
jgi:hypothetical protein